MAEMIETRDLTKDFGAKRAVDRISLKVGRGEVLGFLGPNGAGKSTTMKMVTGFLRPTLGSASICGFDVLDRAIEVKKRLGYLPEGAPLYPDMTPTAFLGFIAEARGLRGGARKRAIEQSIERTQLGSVLRQPIETLSKGFKRRVGLAQALLHDPEVLILDEPTDGLDPNQKHEVRRLIRELAPTKAIVISTHILEEVEAVCSRAVIIAGGKLIADGTPAELAQRSRLHNAVTVIVGREMAERVKAALSGVPGVAAVEVADDGDGSVALTAVPRDGARLLAPINDLVERESWSVREMRSERGNLDEVFRTLTRGEGIAANDAGSSADEREEAARA